MMKRAANLLPFLLSLTTISLFGADDQLLRDTPVESDIGVSHEFNIEGSATGASSMKQGNKPRGEITSQHFAVGYVSSLRLGEGPLLRLGLNWQSYWFERSNSSIAVPSRIDGASLVIGADFELFESWLFRIEAQPGLYTQLSDDLDTNDFNVPFFLAGTYIHDKDLQIVLGLSVDLWRDIPVLPVVGFRWKFADAYVLNFLLPNPRLEMYLSDKALIYAGAELKGGSFRVLSDTGSRNGESKVDNAILDYTEIRAGVGAEYNLTSAMTLKAQVGAVVYRNFNYDRADLSYHTSGAAPYGQLMFSAKF